MSRLVLTIAVIAAFSGPALARGGGGHGGGGHGGGGHGGGHGGGFHGGFHGGGFHGGGHAHFHGGGGHFARAHHAGSGAWHGGHGFRNAGVSSRSIRNALNHGRALNSARLIGNPAARARLAAGAAVMGWHGGVNGWWRHHNGGYGWVGPLFWPFAYYDIYDYTLWGYGGFWGYGYLDIYAGLFGPYGYGGLAGYYGSPQPRQRAPRAASFAQICADDSREVAGLPIDQISQVIEPTEIERAALDELAGASMKAVQTIRASCPTQIAATAPGRLAAMQQRVEAMIAAVALVRSPLERLYGLLDDEQKARFNAIAEDERKKSGAGGLAGTCSAAQPATLAWPTDEIESRLHPNETQRAALGKLQDAAAQAADTLKSACQPSDVLTPIARLDSIGKRLDIMLQAVKSVRSALDDFYATLSDEQKAQFEAIGPRRTS
jgi:hypothetical protein